MNKSRLLWILVAADVLLAFASVGAEAFFGWTLPPSLAQYEKTRFTGVIQLLLLGTTVVCAFGAWIGLLSYWPFARGLYLVATATWILQILYSGPLVRTSVGATFSMVNGLVGGMILGLVYFSDLARRFERAPVERMAAATSLGADRA